MPGNESRSTSTPPRSSHEFFTLRTHPAPLDDPGIAPTLADYGVLLWRWVWWLLAAAAVGFLVACLVVGSRGRLSEASLTIDLSPGAAGNEQYVATQAHLLGSDAVLRPAAEELRIPQRELAARLSLEALPRTSLVQVSFQAANEEQASNAVSAVMASFLEWRERSGASLLEATRTAAQPELEDLRKRMERSGGQVREAARRLGFTGADSKAPALSGRLQQLGAAYGLAAADRAAKEAAYQAFRNPALGTLLASSEADSVRKLIERKNELLQQLAGGQALHSEDHPEYRSAQAQLRELDEEIGAARITLAQRALAELKAAQAREAKIAAELTRATHLGDNATENWLAYQAREKQAGADRNLYEDMVRRLQELQFDGRLAESRPRIVEPLRVRPLASTPRLAVQCLLGLLLGVALASGIVLLTDTVDVRLRRVADLRAITGVDACCVLPAMRDWRGKGPHIAGAATPDKLKEAPYSDAISELGRALAGAKRGAGALSVLVASPRGGEGRSSSAANLGIAMADLGYKALLIDADFESSALTPLFSPVANPPGLSSVLSGSANWRDLLSCQSERPGLHFLPAGVKKRYPDGLDAAALDKLLAEARPDYDLILMDSASFLEHPEATDLACSVDAVLIVTRARVTTQSSLHATLAYLRRIRAQVFGVLLNGA